MTQMTQEVLEDGGTCPGRDKTGHSLNQPRFEAASLGLDYPHTSVGSFLSLGDTKVSGTPHRQPPLL